MKDTKFDLRKLNEFNNGTLWSELKEDLYLQRRTMEEQGKVHTRKMTEEEKRKYGVSEYKDTNNKGKESV